MLKTIDAYKPEQIAKLVEEVAIKKANLPIISLTTLGILAGAFIAFGAMFYTMVITDSQLGLGPTKLLGGVAFSLGLVLVIIAGAELFTGNNLIVIAWADNKISSAQLLKNWLITYFANFIGAVSIAVLAYWSGIFNTLDGKLSDTVIDIANNKIALSFVQAFVRGLLCNVLVCLAVWLCFAAHSVSGKILAIIFPVSAFVALGFEHSIANMYFIPLAMFQAEVDISILQFLENLLPVTLGNIIGGSLFVALFYWVCYLRDIK